MLLLSAFLCNWPGTAHGTTAALPKRPNIVIFMSDDQDLMLGKLYFDASLLHRIVFLQTCAPPFLNKVLNKFAILFTMIIYHTFTMHLCPKAVSWII